MGYLHGKPQLLQVWRRHLGVQLQGCPLWRTRRRHPTWLHPEAAVAACRSFGGAVNQRLIHVLWRFMGIEWGLANKHGAFHGIMSCYSSPKEVEQHRKRWTS